MCVGCVRSMYDSFLLLSIQRYAALLRIREKKEKKLYQAALTLLNNLFPKATPRKKVKEFNFYRIAWHRLIVQEGFYKSLLLHTPHFWSKMRWCLFFLPFFCYWTYSSLNTEIHSSPVYSKKNKICCLDHVANLILSICVKL